MRIITISREFGSGGREIGMRLSDILGFDYYDREIISEVARIGNFDEKFVEDIGEKGYHTGYTVTYGRTFYYPQAVWNNSAKILLAEQQALKGIAERGKDCIIVGRCADVVLEEYSPFNLFVYADMPSKLKRCKQRESDDEQMTDKQLIRKIKEIDKNRAKHRLTLSDIRWGDKSAYHLCVNTSNIRPKEITPIIAEYAKSYFESSEK